MPYIAPCKVNSVALSTLIIFPITWGVSKFWPTEGMVFYVKTTGFMVIFPIFSHTLYSVSLCYLPFMPHHHYSHYFPSSVLWLLYIPSCSLVISKWSFGRERLRRLSSPSQPHLINRAPPYPSEQVGKYQFEWCNVLGGNKKKVITRKRKCGWGVLYSRNLVLRSLILGGGKRLAFCQWQHSVNWIKSTRRPVGL